MEQKINVAELLKDCPKGMELDCTICNGVKFIELDRNPNFPIVVRANNGYEFTLTKYGQVHNIDDAKCVIFPKGKTTWEGFIPPCKFEDGDVCYIKTKNFEHIFIFKDDKDYNHIQEHASLCEDHFYTEYPVCTIDDVKEIRLATEEEKQKLFQAIKANGYRWNPETKTLEKLVKPKFEVGDVIQDIIGICKVKITEVNVENEYYLYKSLNINGIGSITFNRQDDWKLVPTKFDITTLKPFDKVLVRDHITQIWTADLFSFFDKDRACPYVCIGHYTTQCVPYEGNEHLLGTADACAEYYNNW